MTIRPQYILFDVGGHALSRYGVFTRRVASAIRGGELNAETVVRADAATCATFHNRAGIIRMAAAGILRPEFVDLDGDEVRETLGCLSESSRVNLALRSDAFDDAAWTKNDVTVVANQSNGPADEGAQVTMDRIVEAATTAVHSVQQNPTLSDDTVYAYSVYGKTWVGRSWIFIRTVSKANVTHTTWFNIGTGTVGTTGHTAAGIIVEANDSFRCWVRQDAGNGGTTPTAQIGIADADNSSSYLGVVTNGVYLWGAQYEAGLYPSTPITTAAASVTREADRIRIARAFGAMDAITVQVRVLRPIWADLSGTIGPRGLLMISSTGSSLSIVGASTARNWQATIVSGNTQNATVAIPSGTDLTLTAQFYELLTAPKCKVAPTSGVFGTASSAASAPLTAFGDAVIDTGNLANADRFDGTIIRILACRGQFTAAEMAAVP